MARKLRFGWGVGCVTLATIGWSFSGFFARSLPGVDAWTMNAYRVGATAAILFAYLWARYGNEVGKHLWPDQLRPLATIGIVFGGGSTLHLVSLTMASVASIACLGATTPIFAAILAWIFMGERTSGVVFTAAIAAILGVFIIMGAETAAIATGLAGTLVALLVALCFAAQTVALRRHRDIEMVNGIAYGGLMVVGAVALLKGIPLLPWHQVGLLALMALVQLAIPTILFAEGAKHVSAVALTLVALGDVVLNPLWAWIGFGELPPTGTFIGGLIILGSIVTAVGVESRKTRIVGS